MAESVFRSQLESAKKKRRLCDNLKVRVDIVLYFQAHDCANLYEFHVYHLQFHLHIEVKVIMIFTVLK